MNGIVNLHRCDETHANKINYSLLLAYGQQEYFEITNLKFITNALLNQLTAIDVYTRPERNSGDAKLMRTILIKYRSYIK